MPEKKDSGETPFPTYAKFLVGGMAGMMAAFCVHPMDFIKTRMQMSGSGGQKKMYSSSGDAILKIVQKEGVLAVYNGATACVLRQAVYATTRLGLYTTLFGHFSRDGVPPSFAAKTACGMVSGLLAGFLATPMDLCVIRMITDGAKPLDQQFNYKHVFDALGRINQEEGGLEGLYRGAMPTTVRAVIVNGCMLATYSQSKEFLKQQGQKESMLLHVYASVISGFVTAVASLPVDIVKTRVQAQKAGEAKMTVGGVISEISSKEGPLAFWKGFTPYFARLAPITILGFVFLEQLTYYYHVYVLKNEHPRSNM